VGFEQTWHPTEPFRPRWGISNGHFQTIASHLLSRNVALPPSEERLIEVAPGIQVRCECNWQTDSATNSTTDHRDALTVIAVHGLEGSSDSQYLRGIAQKALALGMNAVRMNQRNCGGTEALAPTLYHSGLSSDVGAVVQALVASEKLTRIALVGYSMGGNLVLKLAGEWGSSHTELRAVAAVCPALDLAASADALHDRANRLYELHFVRRLKLRLALKAKLFPERFSVSAANGASSVRAFDNQVTAPFSGFLDANDYYSQAAAANVVDRIAVPTVVVHAADDPFIRILPATRAKLLANPHIHYHETVSGGHCAFLAAPNGYDGYWAERQILDFLRQADERSNLQAAASVPPIASTRSS
jgi:predicted alpha/beta-fold hydrolase